MASGSESMRLGAILARAIAILLIAPRRGRVYIAHWIVITRVVLASSTSCTIMPHQPMKADAETHRVGRSALPAAVPSGSPSYGILVSTWRRMHSRHQSVSTLLNMQRPRRIHLSGGTSSATTLKLTSAERSTPITDVLTQCTCEHDL